MDMITYADKIALNENPEIQENNKITAENMNEIKTVVNNFINDVISNRIQQDITTNGNPVKCGYKIDNKDVYVKRYSSPFNGQTATFAYGLENITITDISGYYANANFSSVFPLPSIRTHFADYTTEIYIANGNVNINTANVGRDGFTAYVYIYFTYND